jgi:hypothetical protein
MITVKKSSIPMGTQRRLRKQRIRIRRAWSINGRKAAQDSTDS